MYGRFLSADWSAVPVAVPYANPTNPQTLNLYAIVRDNPETYVDLDGHEAATGTQGACGDATSGCGGSNQKTTGQDQKTQQQDQTQDQPKPDPNAPKSDRDKPPSWDPSKPLPDDPAKLGPDWKLDPKHDPDNKSGDKRYVNDKTGDKLDWHKGVPGAKGWQGKDHWHHMPEGVKQPGHYNPGDMVRKIGVAGWVATAIYILSEAAEGLEF